MKKVSTKSNFLFKTKADTLKQLVKLVKQSKNRENLCIYY